MDNHPDSFNIHREFCDRMTSELKRWDSLSLKKKFGNQQKYVQFRQRLGEAYQDESAFLSVKSHLAAEDENNSDDEDSSGDELELAGGTQSYKCPLCIRYLSKPMVSKICKHSFCQDCFKSLLESSYNGKVGCPKFGCDKLLDLLSVDLDEGLGQRVNQFRRRAERREIEQEFEDDDEQVESDHDDEGSKRIIDKSSSKKTNVGSQRRKRIVVEDVEDD
ncbi:hypothetical protein BY996DRAFT_6739744 [Phakopsora pachyrhizi]|nr:hypothetical protein BY996DRAFT_6739744 [Phakopsora pachyrhizi]